MSAPCGHAECDAEPVMMWACARSRGVELTPLLVPSEDRFEIMSGRRQLRYLVRQVPPLDLRAMFRGEPSAFVDNLIPCETRDFHSPWLGDIAIATHHADAVRALHMLQLAEMAIGFAVFVREVTRRR